MNAFKTEFFKTILIESFLQTSAGLFGKIGTRKFLKTDLISGQNLLSCYRIHGLTSIIQTPEKNDHLSFFLETKLTHGLMGPLNSMAIYVEQENR
jgi:hypothetical protein